MSSENVIHIKLNYLEALKAKRSILSSELSSLNIAKRIARYRAIRMEELMFKFKLYSKMREAKSNIRKLQSLLPNPKIPRILKREELRERQLKERHPEAEGRHWSYEEESIESQLREIQRRLTELQRENI